MANKTTKIDLSSKSLGEVRKKAVREAYIPKKIKNSCIISTNASGDVTIMRKKKS
jgi:hypothetical protein